MDVSKAFIELIRTQAAIKFPPAPQKMPGEEPFNHSEFIRAAFGSYNRCNQKWKRVANKPENLSIEDAICFSNAVGIPFVELIAIATAQARGVVPSRSVSCLDARQASG